MAFYPKYLLIILKPHAVHTKNRFFPYCILYVYLHALHRRLPLTESSGYLRIIACLPTAVARLLPHLAMRLVWPLIIYVVFDRVVAMFSTDATALNIA